MSVTAAGNRARFPPDFMLQLTAGEVRILRSQIVTLDSGRRMHRKYLPFAFTEQGVAMLSSQQGPDQVSCRLHVRSVIRRRGVFEVPIWHLKRSGWTPLPFAPHAGVERGARPEADRVELKQTRSSGKEVGILGLRRKHLSKRTESPALRRPVRDREDNIREVSGEFGLQGCAEV